VLAAVKVSPTPAAVMLNKATVKEVSS